MLWVRRCGSWHTALSYCNLGGCIAWSCDILLSYIGGVVLCHNVMFGGVILVSIPDRLSSACIGHEHLNSTFYNGMGLSLVNGISPCFLAFSRGGIIPNVTCRPSLNPF